MGKEQGFTPIKKKPRIRKITTYDLEWLPETMKLRCVGVYDERGYRVYTDQNGVCAMDRFLNKELTAKNTGRWFYAHAGGLADVQFVLEKVFQRKELNVGAAFSGSSAIIVKIQKGKYKWNFLDSFWTLQGSLAKIGASMNMPKGDCAWDAPMAELIDYNEQDCRILWEALSGFQRFVLGLGGEQKMTLASTAMALFRRRFLTRNITIHGRVNDRLRPSYFGGRVEVFDKYVHHGYYYDINSSYPAAMTKRLPAQLQKLTDKIPKKTDLMYFADVEINVKPCRIPPLPYRQNATMYFPTGRWRSWFAQEELEWALDQGHEIERVHEVMLFDTFDDMRAYSETLYQMRRDTNDPFTKQNLKLLLNSLYGKTAERREREELVINPGLKYFKCQHQAQNNDDYCKACKGPCVCIACGKRMMFPGVFNVPTIRSVPHEHLPLASAITARARVSLARFMTEAKSVHYCDTDGFASSEPDVPTDPKLLGALKCEKVFERAQFIRPKLYRMDQKVKAKGFPKKPAGDGKSAPFDESDFEKVLVGGVYEFERMPRIKEVISKANQGAVPFRPSRAMATKKLQNSVRDKRCMYSDGSSRAWTVDELTERFSWE